MDGLKNGGDYANSNIKKNINFIFPSVLTLAIQSLFEKKFSYSMNHWGIIHF